jgi:hypothetical protein
MYSYKYVTPYCETTDMLQQYSNYTENIYQKKLFFFV